MVPGEGPIPCFLMVIGEAPGRTEEKEGRPFCGRSGRLLDYLLLHYGVDRKNAYVTNVVKEMPLDDDGKIRRPFQEEVYQWAGELTIEMDSVDPTGVLLLGTTAYRAVTDDWEGRVPWGTTFTQGDITYGIIWHPAYLLRRGEKEFPQWRQQAKPLFDAFDEFR